jgi:RND superfamily putative drug exporter
MRLNSATVARASARHPWWVVGIWAVVLAASAALAAFFLADGLTTDFSFTDHPESQQAADLIKGLRGPATMPEIVVVNAASSTAQDPAFSSYVASLTASLKTLVGKTDAVSVGSYLDQTGPVSQDGHTALLPVMVQTGSFAVMQDIAGQMQAIIAASDVPQGFTVETYGQGTQNEDFNRLAEEGLQRGESIGIAIALLILIVVFGSIVAAVVPIVLGIVAILVAFGLTAIVGQLMELSFFVTNMITMIGLAVGIDYSLFIVSRYREERLRGYDKVDALERAGATASRAVFFSGLIVVLALSSLLLIPASIFVSLGLGAIAVVLSAVVAALTLLPAVLSLLGDNVERLRVRRQATDPERHGGIWDRITTRVMAHPWLSLSGCVVILLLLASSYLRLQSGFAGVTTLPADAPSRQAYQLMADAGFPPGEGTPVEIVVEGTITPQVDQAITQLQDEMSAMTFQRDGVTSPLFAPATVQTAPSGDLAVVSAALFADFQNEASTGAVRTLRQQLIPAAFGQLGVRVLVGGGAAFVVDFLDDASQAQPIVFAWVLGLSFLVLLLVFRSLVIPATSILMNLLSVGAAYGILVLVFQNGEGHAPLLGIFTQVDAIEPWMPLMLFAVLFGLSMDYQIFLLSRIKEAHDLTGDTAQAVSHGLRTTGAIITGAALIMVAVFFGFALGQLAMLQQMGVGLAVAVLLDAFLVRTILVPATMKILGRWNWYFPKFLRFLPHIDFEAGGHGRTAPAEAMPSAPGGARD